MLMTHVSPLTKSFKFVTLKNISCVSIVVLFVIVIAVSVSAQVKWPAVTNQTKTMDKVVVDWKSGKKE